MVWTALGLWVFGSVCFAVGAWWATRPDAPEPPEESAELLTPGEDTTS